MKRFLIFTYSKYTPGGGLNDCKESYDTIEEAVNRVGDYLNKHDDVGEILDTKTGDILDENGISILNFLYF